MTSRDGKGKKVPTTHIDLVHAILFALFFSWFVAGRGLASWHAAGLTLSLVPWLVLAPIGPLVLAFIGKKWFRSRNRDWFAMGEAFDWRMREFKGAVTPGDRNLVMAKSWLILVLAFAGTSFCLAYLGFGLFLGKLDASLAFFTCATFFAFLAHLHWESLFLQRVWWNRSHGHLSLGVGLLVATSIFLGTTILAWVALHQNWTLPLFVPLTRLSG